MLEIKIQITAQRHDTGKISLRFKERLKGLTKKTILPLVILKPVLNTKMAFTEC